MSADLLCDTIDRGNGMSKPEQAFLPDAKPILETESLQAILMHVVSHAWPVPLVDDQNFYRGVITKNSFLRTLYRAENGAHFEQQAGMETT